MPDTNVKQSVAGQLTGELKTTDVVISHVGPGEPFGWTAIAREGGATAGAVAQVDSKVVAFDMDKMMQAFEEDPTLGCTMLRHVLRSAQPAPARSARGVSGSHLPASPHTLFRTLQPGARAGLLPYRRYS